MIFIWIFASVIGVWLAFIGLCIFMGRRHEGALPLPKFTQTGEREWIAEYERGEDA